MTGDTKKCTYLEGYIAILFAPINQLLKLSPGKWKMLIVRLILSLRADNYFHPVFPCYKNICFWWQYTLKQVKFITIYLQFILAFLTYGQIKLDSCLALKYISIFHWIFSLSVRNVFHTKHLAMWGKKKGRKLTTLNLPSLWWHLFLQLVAFHIKQPAVLWGKIEAEKIQPHYHRTLQI